MVMVGIFMRVLHAVELTMSWSQRLLVRSVQRIAFNSSRRAGGLVRPQSTRRWTSSAAQVDWSQTLNTGAKIPAFGLGTWLSKRGEVGVAVDAALREGYRHIDCAHLYNNEAEVGEAVQKCVKDGVIERDDIFITSKLWNTDHRYSDVLPACQTTLKNLQLDYLDLYLVHWPLFLNKTGRKEERLLYDAEVEAECWQAMEELVSKGLVKAIGISNFSITKTERLLQTAKIVPAVNQVECHPYFQQQKLKDYCDSKGIAMEAYSPLGSPGSPFLQGKEPKLVEDAVIKEISEKNGASFAQVCIAFALHRGLVVIPKSVTPSRISENLKATKVKLDAEDMKRLGVLGSKNFRYVSGDFFPNRDPEWTDSSEYLWDTTEDENFVLAVN